ELNGVAQRPYPGHVTLLQHLLRDPLPIQLALDGGGFHAMERHARMLMQRHKIPETGRLHWHMFDALQEAYAGIALDQSLNSLPAEIRRQRAVALALVFARRVDQVRAMAKRVKETPPED